MCEYGKDGYAGLPLAEQARAETKTPLMAATGRKTLETLGKLVTHAAERGHRTLDLNMVTGFMTGFKGNAENMSLSRSMCRWLDVNAGKLETEYGYRTEQYREQATGQLVRLVLIW